MAPAVEAVGILGGNFWKKQTVSHGLPLHRPPYGQDEPHVLTKHFLGLNESHLPCGRCLKTESTFYY
uniref:Uncharacterized protein n=2 Tax=Cercopithecinae TaxID=9528 RepID=A0A2K5YPF2_MANLE